MPAALFPTPNRSPTAAAGQGDVRDEYVYSAIVLQHGGSGTGKLFTVPDGQTIPSLRGAGITASTQAHHGSHTSLTTNLGKAGEVGPSIGDLGVRGLGIILENAAFTASSGAARAFGATQFEVADICSKCSFELLVSGKRNIIGPVVTFPGQGAAFGSISTSGNAATASIASNGWPGSYKKLKYPILIGRSDGLEGRFQVASTAALAFSVQNADGQPLLAWCVLNTGVMGDVR